MKLSWKFILKETGFYNYFREPIPFIILTIFISLFSFYFLYDDSFDFNKKIGIYIASLTLSLLLNIIFLELINMTLLYIRKKIPSKIIKIIEDNKEYTLKEYAYFGIQEYYYKGLLHREKGVAVSHKFGLEEYYLYGELVKEEDILKLIKQNKLNNF